LILKNILLKAQIKNIAVTYVEYFFEGCGAQLIINNMKLILLAIYRPSNEDSNAEIPLFLERLQSVLEEIRLKGNSLLAGDFNIDLLEHSYHANHLTIRDITQSYDLRLINEGEQGKGKPQIVEHF
jgi:hypothetical protein